MTRLELLLLWYILSALLPPRASLNFIWLTGTLEESSELFKSETPHRLIRVCHNNTKFTQVCLPEVKICLDRSVLT